MKIVLASSNQGKILEFNKLFADTNLDIIPQTKFNFLDVKETGLTFVENAILKARNASFHTGLVSIADDSGLEVDYLKGKPGIYSKRFAGENATDQQNINKLLQDLQGVENRKANFRCVLVFLLHHLDPSPIIAQASWRGEILQSSQGENGFGYDPIFFLKDRNLTAAQLPKDIKNKISHRGQALKILQEKLNKLKITELIKNTPVK